MFVIKSEKDIHFLHASPVKRQYYLITFFIILLKDVACGITVTQKHIPVCFDSPEMFGFLSCEVFPLPLFL